MTGEDLKRGWCPSLQRPMESGDGWLSRIHPPQAVVSAALARAVAEASARYGNGRIEITNRANLQIRGLQPDTIPPFGVAMEAAGAAEVADGRVLLSPLAGADPGLAPETMAIARAATEGLSRIDDLPAKFGLLVDGGGALPLTGIGLDVTLRCAGGQWRVNGEACPTDLVAGLVAERALALIRALADAPRAVPSRVGSAPRLGFHPYGTGAAGFLLLAPPFGQMEAVQLAALAGLATRWGDGGLRPTPWKTLAIAGVTPEAAGRLAEAVQDLGLIADPDDPRLTIVTCAGAPACPRGGTETHPVATALAESRQAGDPQLHLSGCAKGCAHPGAAPLTLVATAGAFDLIRDGRPGDLPAARHLTLAQSRALMQSLPA